MNQPKITQDNVHLLLPNKVAQLADRLLQNGVAADMPAALNMVYSSPVYANCNYLLPHRNRFGIAQHRHIKISHIGNFQKRHIVKRVIRSQFYFFISCAIREHHTNR